MIPSTTYAVVLHSTGERGGWVVRTVRDGSLAAPYRDAPRAAEYRRRAAAQNAADRLNRAAR